jgi:hypothetical protein
MRMRVSPFYFQRRVQGMCARPLRLHTAVSGVSQYPATPVSNMAFRTPHPERNRLFVR